MDVHFPESDDPYDRSLKYWEPAGKTLAWGSSIIAAATALPAMLKKKRTYSQMTPIATNGGAVAVQEGPAGSEELPLELRPPSEKRERIAELFNLTAEDFILNGARLNTVGAQVEADSVHPYAFLMSIPRNAIQQIFRLQLRRVPLYFITDGIARGMQRERGSLERLLPAFASSMQKETAPIRQLILAADWQGLLRYLFDIPV